MISLIFAVLVLALEVDLVVLQDLLQRIHVGLHYFLAFNEGGSKWHSIQGSS